jgi:pantoate--beta-alanine ligase
MLDADSSPPIDRTIADLRRRVGNWRSAGEIVALVPTMGALHRGHLALVEAARQRAARAVVSIFVNPAQFAPTEDFQSYPRDEARDLAQLAGLADAVFAPGVAEMYPPGFATAVSVAGPALGLETDFRPHFFGGVATVVARLLLAAAPDIAMFGEKDFQQLMVIRRMVADLAIPVEIVGLATVREEDGLALSSRNAYLTPEQRAAAPDLYQTLETAAAALRAGAMAVTTLAEARQHLTAAGFDVDYLELRDADTLAEVADRQVERLRLLVAARLGHTRLIDNIAV